MDRSAMMFKQPKTSKSYISFNKQLRLCQYIMQNIPRDNPLHNICPIQAIHAICAKGSFLPLFHLYQLILPLLHCHLEVPNVFNIVLNLFDKFGEISPFHFPALSMEIEPDVF
jgi:hypothetical protein